MELADKMLRALQRRTADMKESGKVEGSHGIITEDLSMPVRPKRVEQPKPSIIDAEVIEKATPLRTAQTGEAISRVASRLAESRLQYRTRRNAVSRHVEENESDSFHEPFQKKPQQKEKRGRIARRNESSAADEILSRLEYGKNASLLKYSICNINDILDEDDTMSTEVWEALLDSATKEQLLSYLEIVLATLR